MDITEIVFIAYGGVIYSEYLTNYYNQKSLFMNKLKKMLCVVAAMFAAVTSYAATAADYTDIVYAKDVKASLGGTVEVPIYLKNASYTVKSLQFSMELPDGISFVEETGVGHKFTKNALTNNWTISFRTKDGEAANTGLAMMSYQNDAITTIATGDVEVFKIHLQVASTTSAGTKNIIMKGITLTAGDGTENTILSGEQTITSNVNIQRAEVIESMPEGYGFSISSFTPEVGENTINFMFRAPVDIRTIEFDLKLPKGLLMYNSSFEETSPVINTEATYGTPTITLTGVSDDRTTAHVAFTGAAGLSKKYFKSSTSNIVCATLKTLILSEEQFSEEISQSIYGIENGIQKIELSNILFTDNSDGTTQYKGEHICSITVGTPTDKDPIIYGNITDASTVTAAIPADATSVDISQATATDAVVDAIVTDAQTKNANAVVYAPSTYNGSKNNVVKEDSNGSLTCSNFVITDGKDVEIPASFNATNASYTREMSQTWGTICLPYDVTSDATTEYYNITALNAGVLTISKLDNLPAGTPALVRKLSGTGIAPTATNVSVGGNVSPVSGTVDMYGSFKKVNITTQNSYYLKNDNKFYKINGNFNCVAFRAYFVVSTSAAKHNIITIGDDELTAINALVGESDVKVEAIYDASGARHSEMKSGLNIIKLSNGKTQKIMVK